MVGNVIRTVMSRSVNQPEMSAVEAAVNNMAIPGFNNRQSNVFESSDKPTRRNETLPLPTMWIGRPMMAPVWRAARRWSRCPRDDVPAARGWPR
jgi:hypothetical protein